MRTVAALLAGLMLSTLTFVAGLVIALAYLNIDEPQRSLDTTNDLALWSTAPVAVDRQNQPFERVAAATAAIAQVQVASVSETDGNAKSEIDRAANTEREVRQETIDPMITGSMDPAPRRDERAALDALRLAHEEWCTRRYRSYSPDTNTYRPHSGGQSACRSPYSDVAALSTTEPALEDGASETAAEHQEYTQITEEEGTIGPASYNATADFSDVAHIEDCLRRYRSYTPHDNTFQPYGGGPRQQCL